MRVQVNIEFTPEELVKHASDLGRRWLHGLLAEGASHVGPNGVSSIFEALSSAIRAASPPPSVDKPIEYVPIDRDHQPSPKCLRVETEDGHESGWACHLCVNFNDDTCDQCKRCGHERCDIVITPPPSPNAPSGTA